jgi:hypothetical protein
LTDRLEDVFQPGRPAPLKPSSEKLRGPARIDLL